MNAKKLTLRLAAVALIATGASTALFVGCGSNNSGNPAPTQRDSSTSDATHETGVPDGGKDVTSETANETSIPDTGNCETSSSSCNTCYTDAQAASDPLNACSQYTKNCVHVSLTVPTHPAIP
jgi:hypothetical protein